MYKNGKWISIFITLLALLAFAELIFTVTLLLFFNDILYQLGAHLSTVGGFVSSLVTLPSSFKIKTTFSSTEFHSHFEDVTSYYKFVLYLSFGMQCLACFLCIHSFSQLSLSSHHFTILMKHYNHRLDTKVLVDTIQLLLQCCGTHSYEEWLAQNNNEKSHQTTTTTTEDCLLLMPNQEENYYNIPYSCCNLNSKKSCENYDVVNLGTETINKKGCSKQIIAFLLSITLTEITLYAFVATTIGASLWVINANKLEPSYKAVPPEEPPQRKGSAAKESPPRKESADEEPPPRRESEDEEPNPRRESVDEKPPTLARSMSSAFDHYTKMKMQEMLEMKKRGYSSYNKYKSENKKHSTNKNDPQRVEDTPRDYEIFERDLETPEDELDTPEDELNNPEDESATLVPNEENPPTPLTPIIQRTQPTTSTPNKPNKPSQSFKILDPKQSQSTNTIKPRPQNQKLTRVQMFLKEEFPSFNSRSNFFTQSNKNSNYK